MNPQDVMLAADTSNVQAGGNSWTSGAADALTYGAGAAVLSGMNSILNTGVAVNNFFGGDAEKFDTSKQLANVDANWGSYYDQHKDVIDTVGFVATSFIPGGLAVKGLNLARRGEAFGAFGKALNYTATAQAANLEKSLQVLASAEGSVFTKLNKNFLGSLGWGMADNVIQMGAFELGVAATMSASPLLEGQSAKDFGYDILKNALFGGAIGGTIEGVFANKILKNAMSSIDTTGKKYSATLPEAMERISISSSDKAFSYLDAIEALPKAIFEDDRALAFTYRLGGVDRTVEGGLKTGALYDKQLQATISKGYLEFERHVTTGLTADPTVGRVVASSLLDLVAEGKKAGLASDAIRARAGDYLFNLQQVDGVVGELSDLADLSIRYFNKGGPAPTDLADGFTSLLSKTAAPDLTRMRLTGDIGDLKMSLIGRDHMLTKDAWADGMDIAFQPNGVWSVNPASKLLRPAPESPLLRTFFNTQTKQTSDTAALTIADIGTLQRPLKVEENGGRVTSGDRVYNFSQAKPLASTADSIEQTARHLWANSLKKIEGEVDANDFSLLDKMAASKNIVDDETMIATIPPTNWKNLGNFDKWVMQNKVNYLKEKFSIAEAGSLDIQKVALEVNATPEWVQNVIASKFDTKLGALAEAAPDLTKGASRDLADYANRENVLLSYKRPPSVLAPEFGSEIPGPKGTPFNDRYGGAILADQTQPFLTGQMAYGYRVKLATDNLEVAGNSVLGPENWGKLSAWDAKGLTDTATREGAGANLVTASNAGYGDGLKLMAQTTGKIVSKMANSFADSVLGQLQPMMAQIKNSPVDAAELTAIVTKIRRSSEKFTMLGTEYGLDGTYIVDKQLLKGSTEETIAAIRDAAKSGNTGEQAYLVNSEMTANFLKTHMEINADTVGKRQVLLNAQGITSNIDPGTLYVPPIDTRKVPFFAFVRQQEGAIFSESNVSMITARNAEELLKLTSQVDTARFQVIFKKDSEAFFKAKGDYDYSRGLNDSAIHSGLKKEGKLGDFMPNFKPEDVLEDFIQYHQRQQTQLVRDAVSTKYAQPFSELRRLSEDYTAASTSKVGIVDKFFNRAVNDPYDDYIKTALDISKRSEFTLLHQTNEFIDAVGTRAYAGIANARDQATKGSITWEEANQAMVRYGMPGPYADAHAFNLAQTSADRNLIKIALQKINMVLTTGLLRFDMANSMLNIISTPILLGTEVSSIRRSIANDAGLTGKLDELLNLNVPGGGQIPSTTKLTFNAIGNYFKEGKEQLLQRYKDNGDIGSTLSLHHQMMGELAVPNQILASEFSKKASEWTEKIATGTMNNFAEQFTRFVSADVMRQITDPLIVAGRMGIAEQNAYISVFVNRVQGNYLASQRPILFQGTLGSAVGLFQTYQFNLLQQLFRHVENRDLRTAAVMGGMQSGVFGLNGLPMFEAINTHIIGSANMNPGHKDIYTRVTEAAGKDMGDWLLYGTASAFPLFSGNAPALYTRGDVNPRHPTIIPVSPMDVPAVDATIRFVGNIINVGKKLAEGGGVASSLLGGLEHNSINRPLAGLAQAVQGGSTTSKGSLIAASSDLWSIANASRVIGAKPMDESVGLNTKFRSIAYQAEDKERLNVLGQVVKDKLRDNTVPTEEDYIDFAGKYAKAGGQVGGFSAALQGWAKDANTSVLNQMADHTKSTYGQRFAEVMGGTRMDNGVPSKVVTPPVDTGTE